MTRISGYQKTNRKVASAQLDSTTYEIMIRMAELTGHETISSFVKDAICEKCQMTASSVSGLMNDRLTKAF